MTSNNATAVSKEPCFCDLGINANIYANNGIVAALHVPFAIFAMVSNAAVIFTVIKTNSLHRPPNILLCSLAFGDFLVGAMVQPLLVILLLMHNAGVNCCELKNTPLEVYTFVLPIMALGSYLQVCVMCWDRYKAVSSPMNYRTTVTNWKMIKIAVASWVAWITFIILLKVIPQVAKGLMASLALASFIIICVVSQIATLKTMRRQNNQIAPAATADMFSREKKMAVTLCWVLGSLLLSAAPQVVFSISFNISAVKSLGFALFWPWVRLVMCLSSSLNPVIYFWRHEGMRSAGLQLIGR